MEVQQQSPQDGTGLAPNHHWTRLLHGIGANLLGKVWVVVGQVISVPVLLHVWGAKGYGLWLMISAIPSYAVLSDFGFGSAAAVLMIQLVAKGRKDEALGVFQSVVLLISGILSLVLLAGVGGFFAFPLLARLLGMGPPQPDVARAFLILMIYSTFVAEMWVIGMGFKSTRRYARGTILLDLTIPLETAALLIAAVTTRSFVVCALAQLAVRAPAFILYYIRLRLDEPWLHIGWSKASWSVIRQLAKPSLANFGLPLAQSMSIQGVVFTVGLAFGPAAAGVFGAVRTFTRLPLQLVGVLTRASQPELSLAHSVANTPLVVRLTSLNLAVTLLTFAPFVLASPWGGQLMHLLARGHMGVPSGLFAVMEVVAFVQATWSTLAMFLIAENKLQRIVPWCIAAAFAAMVTPLVLQGQVSLTQLTGVLGGLDFVVLLAAFRIWWRASGLKFSDFVELGRNPLEIFSKPPAQVSAQETSP